MHCARAQLGSRSDAIKPFYLQGLGAWIRKRIPNMQTFTIRIIVTAFPTARRRGSVVLCDWLTPSSLTRVYMCAEQVSVHLFYTLDSRSDRTSWNNFSVSSQSRRPGTETKAFFGLQLYHLIWLNMWKKGNPCEKVMFKRAFWAAFVKRRCPAAVPRLCTINTRKPFTMWRGKRWAPSQ